MKVINTEIIDAVTLEDMKNGVDTALVSVLVEVEIDGIVYYLDYQKQTKNPKTTSPSCLASVSDEVYEKLLLSIDSYEDLIDYIDDTAKLKRLRADIANEANIANIWSEYIKKEFNINDVFNTTN